MKLKTRNGGKGGAVAGKGKRRELPNRIVLNGRK